MNGRVAELTEARAQAEAQLSHARSELQKLGNAKNELVAKDGEIKQLAEDKKRLAGERSRLAAEVERMESLVQDYVDARNRMKAALYEHALLSRANAARDFYASNSHAFSVNSSRLTGKSTGFSLAVQQLEHLGLDAELKCPSASSLHSPCPRLQWSNWGLFNQSNFIISLHF